MTIPVDTSYGSVRKSHLVDTLVAENVHHPARQLDVEKNDHVVGVLHSSPDCNRGKTDGPILGVGG